MYMINLTEIKNNLKALLNSIYFNNGKIFISFSNYNSLKETNYLLSSAKNRKHLEESIQQLHDNKI